MRTWILLPWAVPAAVTAILWRWMFDATSGIINTSMMGLGVLEKPLLFLANPEIAGISLTFVNSWRYVPFLTIIFLASLASVPEEELEAAKTEDEVKSVLDYLERSLLGIDAHGYFTDEEYPTVKRLIQISNQS